MSVKRYDIEAYLYYDDCRWETTESVDGDFVYASDYDELRSRVARLEGVVRMLISCVEDASVLAFDDELESARCALEDECHESPA